MQGFNQRWIPEESVGYWEIRYGFPGISAERAFRMLSFWKFAKNVRRPEEED